MRNAFQFLLNGFIIHKSYLCAHNFNSIRQVEQEVKNKSQSALYSVWFSFDDWFDNNFRWALKDDPHFGRNVVIFSMRANFFFLELSQTRKNLHVLLQLDLVPKEIICIKFQINQPNSTKAVKSRIVPKQIGSISFTM